MTEVRKFNQLTWIKKTDERRGNGAVLHLFLCDCGNHTKLPYNKASRGHTKSCGCRRRPREVGKAYHFLDYQGESKTVAQWSDYFGVSRSTAYGRIRRGMRFEEVFEIRKEICDS